MNYKTLALFVLSCVISNINAMERTKIPAPKDQFALGLMEINGRSLNQCYLATSIKAESKVSIEDLFRAEAYMHRVAKEALNIPCTSSQITELFEEEHKENPPLIITNAKAPRKKRKNADDEIVQEQVKRARQEREFSIKDIAKDEALLLNYMSKGEIETIATLIDQKLIDINQHINGQSLLHHAMRMNSSEKMITMLLEKGADVNNCNESQSTPLHIACNKRNVETIKLLLKYGARTDIPNKMGSYPIHILIANTRTEALKVLLQHESVNQIAFKNKKGQTPLMLARGKAFSVPFIVLLVAEYEKQQQGYGKIPTQTPNQICTCNNQQ